MSDSECRNPMLLPAPTVNLLKLDTYSIAIYSANIDYKRFRWSTMSISRVIEEIGGVQFK